MAIALTSSEFTLMRGFIEKKCGISIGQEKMYLIENRLSKLLVETGCSNFKEFYIKICNNKDGEIVEKLIDAITTNETMWFRDKSPWIILEEVFMPAYIDEIRKGIRKKVRIWSAACSSGQEPYSTAMCIDNYFYQNNIRDISIDAFEIIATDISQSMIDAAKSRQYANIAIMRGLEPAYRNKYFKNEGQVWTLHEKIGDIVKFEKFNLQDTFYRLGNFDIIFCRYVTIYFSSEFKKEVIRKTAKVLNPSGVMFLGNSEIFMDYKEEFNMEEYKGGVFYRVRKGESL